MVMTRAQHKKMGKTMVMTRAQHKKIGKTMVMTRAQHKKMGKTAELEMGGLCEELIEEILNCIPIKPLIRMKCLSKGWCGLISRYRLSRPRTSTFKFLCHYRFCDNLHYRFFENLETQLIFLDEKEQGGEIENFENKFLSFSIDQTLMFYGASNGLLLLSYCKSYSDKSTNYVCNPTLNEWVALPQVCVIESDSHVESIGMGLAFDGLPQDHYKVVCFALDRGKISATGHLECVIFSSDICAWRKHISVLLNSSFVKKRELYFIPRPQYLYRKGMIHWVLNGYMLVYHIQKDFFKLIKLPTQNSGYSYSNEYARLWESEGSLHISYSNKDKLRICAFVPDNIDPDGIAYMEADQFTHGRWQFKHILELVTLRTQHPVILGTVPENLRMFLEPCGFDEDLQLLYIRLPGMIVSYSFETKTLKKAWTFQESGNIVFCRSFCMRLTGVRVPLGGDSKLLHPEKVPRGNGGRLVLLL